MSDFTHTVLLWKIRNSHYNGCKGNRTKSDSQEMFSLRVKPRIHNNPTQKLFKRLVKYAVI